MIRGSSAKLMKARLEHHGQKVLLAAETSAFKKETARDHGACGWLAKPLSEAWVLKAGARVLG